MQEGPSNLDWDSDLDNDDLDRGKVLLVVAKEPAHSLCLIFLWVTGGAWCTRGCGAGFHSSLRAVNSGEEGTE